MSKIHTCYTGIGGYFVKGFGGIRADDEAPGMKSFLVKPALVGDLTYANTEYKSLYGHVVVKWKKINNTAKIHIEIPINTKAKIYLPATSKEVVKESGILAEKAKGVKFLGSEKSEAVGNYVIFSVESGVYDFEVSNLPVTSLPNPKFVPKNLTLIARANASSMFIETEKLPGFEAFKANDSKDTTYWQAGDVNNQYLEFEWLKPQTFNSVVINEKGESIEDYEVQYWKNDKWTNVAKGQKCGNNKIHEFQRVTASKCRILIKSAAKAALISEFKIFNTTTN